MTEEVNECPLCEKIISKCVLCGEDTCFCTHFCYGDQSENLKRAKEQGLIKPFTEEDAKRLMEELKEEE